MQPVYFTSCEQHAQQGLTRLGCKSSVGRIRQYRPNIPWLRKSVQLNCREPFLRKQDETCFYANPGVLVAAQCPEFSRSSVPRLDRYHCSTSISTTRQPCDRSHYAVTSQLYLFWHQFTILVFYIVFYCNTILNNRLWWTLLLCLTRLSRCCGDIFSKQPQAQCAEMYRSARST